MNAATTQPEATGYNLSEAVTYLLRRLQQDPRLASLIGPGSQCYELLMKEAAQAKGQELDLFRREFEQTLKYEMWPADLLSEGIDLMLRVNKDDPIAQGLVNWCERANKVQGVA